jgi:hypothetical protein
MGHCFDLVTGIIATVVAMLRQEVMARILDGRIDPANAEQAWRMLDDGKWTAQAVDNAAWFASRAKKGREV